MGGATDLLHDKRFPRFSAGRRVRDSRVDEELDERDAARASIDLFAELGIERDRSLQKQCRDGLVIEAAGAQERVIDGREIVPVLIKSGANSVEVTERRKELERARQQAFALKQMQQPSGAGLEEALARPMASRPRRRRSATQRTPRG